VPPVNIRHRRHRPQINWTSPASGRAYALSEPIEEPGCDDAHMAVRHMTCHSLKFVGNSVKRSTGNRYAPFSRYPAAKVRIPIFVLCEYCAARCSRRVAIRQNGGGRGTRYGANSASVLRKRSHWCSCHVAAFADSSSLSRAFAPLSKSARASIGEPARDSAVIFRPIRRRFRPAVCPRRLKLLRGACRRPRRVTAIVQTRPAWISRPNL